MEAFIEIYEGEGWEDFAFHVMFRRTFDVIRSRGFLFALLWRIVRVGLDWSSRWPSFSFRFGLFSSFSFRAGS